LCVAGGMECLQLHHIPHPCSTFLRPQFFALSVDAQLALTKIWIFLISDGTLPNSPNCVVTHMKFVAYGPNWNIWAWVARVWVKPSCHFCGERTVMDHLLLVHGVKFADDIIIPIFWIPVVRLSNGRHNST
jgi:hypothetical protein